MAPRTHANANFPGDNLTYFIMFAFMIDDYNRMMIVPNYVGFL